MGVFYFLLVGVFFLLYVHPAVCTPSYPPHPPPHLQVPSSLPPLIPRQPVLPALEMGTQPPIPTLPGSDHPPLPPLQDSTSTLKELVHTDQRCVGLLQSVQNAGVCVTVAMCTYFTIYIHLCVLVMLYNASFLLVIYCGSLSRPSPPNQAQCSCFREKGEPYLA